MVLALIAASLALNSPIYARNKGQDAAVTLAVHEFGLNTESEVMARLTASAPGTSWGKSGAEAAILTCYVDDRYNQDVILFMGGEKFPYKATLGRLAAGRHKIRFEINKRLGSKGAVAVNIGRISVSTVQENSGKMFAALSHAPILYARRNSIGHFTDIPLLMWYEVFDDKDSTRIRYSYVFTNEDGGTATEALMARWGRATDIEWAYEVRLRGGSIQDETYQAVNHRATAFGGSKVGLHPLLLVASDNNNFADTGNSALRFALVPELMDLSRHSREEIMDRHPWAYKLMAQELEREGKISEAGGHFIRDPRNYVYIEARAPQPNMGIGFRVGLKDGKWFDSNLGRRDLNIQREGWFRVAVRLPVNEFPKQTRGITIDCHPAMQPDQGTACRNVEVQKVFMLDQNYRPHRLRSGINLAGISQ